MAAGSASVTSAANALKKLYGPEKLEDLLYQMSPLLGMLPKYDDFEGDGTLNITVEHGGQQGVTGNLPDAMSGKTSNVYKRFAVTRGQVYAVGSIDGLLIRASRSNKGAIVRSLDKEQKRLLRALQRNVSMFVFGNGGGALGQFTVTSGAGTTTYVFQLSRPADVVWFEVEQTLIAYSTDGLTSGTARANAGTVSAVNRRTGAITVTTTVAGNLDAWANNDYMFIKGECPQTHGAQTAVAQNITGLGGWLPIADPTATAFFGVDRTVDPTRLAGIRYLDNAGGPILETLQMAMGFAKQEGCTADTIVMNPIDIQKLCVSLEGKTYITRSAERSNGSKSAVGYRGVVVATPLGDMGVFSDSGCPVGRAYALDLDTISFHHVGELFGYCEDDGLTMLRESAADAYTWRMAVFGNVVVDAPGRNAIVAL